MIVVAVLMMSCHVSNGRITNDGAHTRMSRTQKAKNGARLANRAACPANLSKNPIRLLTSLGRCGSFDAMYPLLPLDGLAETAIRLYPAAICTQTGAFSAS